MATDQPPTNGNNLDATDPKEELTETPDVAAHEFQKQPTAEDEKEPIHGISHNGSSSVSSDGARDKTTETPSKPYTQKPASIPPPTPKKPSIASKIWTRLKPPTIILMLKGAVAPTIAMSIYQAPNVANIYLTLGYLVVIASILGLPILPRGKHIQHIILVTLGICVGACIALLGQWSGIKARQHTSAGKTPLEAAGYSSSASVVNGIWLTATIYAANALRAAKPQFNLPVIAFTIFTMVAFSFGPTFPTEAASRAFVQRLLECFLTGFAIAFGVGMFLIPITSRKVFFGETTGFWMTSRALLKAQVGYVESLEHSDAFQPLGMKDEVGHDGKKKHKHHLFHHPTNKKVGTPEDYVKKSAELRAKTQSMIELAAKLKDDVTFAKREIAYGHLDGTAIGEMHQLIRGMFLPMLGLSTVSDIFERISKHRSWRRAAAEAEEAAMHAMHGDDVGAQPGTKHDEAPEEPSEVNNEVEQDVKLEWMELMRCIHSSFDPVSETLDEGVTHALILLKLIPDPRAKAKKAAAKAAKKDGTEPQESPTAPEDLEQGQRLKPGDIGFADYVDKRTQDFHQQRAAALQEWAHAKGLHTTVAAFSGTTFNPDASKYAAPEELKAASDRRAARQLYLILYMSFLLYSVSNATLSLVRFAEAKVADGSMAKQRVMIPQWRIFRKWIKAIISSEDTKAEFDQVDNMASNLDTVKLGDSLRAKKDPEHLPAKNAWEKFGNGIRGISHFLGSPSSSFGFRVAVASMSIGILAYLKDTHVFFIEQRVVWGMIMVAIGMSPTSGNATFGFIGRTLATFVAMISSYVNWYMVDGHTAGVLVFMFVFMMIYFYFLLKWPRLIVIVIITIITHVLIIGKLTSHLCIMSSLFLAFRSTRRKHCTNIYY
jgi:Putative ER transporter, 6TM, N-terminal/Fusaric acid resistance protein-like